MDAELKPEEVKLLADLCRIPSPSGQEGEAAAYLVGFLRNRGWQAAVDAAGNVVGETGTGEKMLLFLGHLDTAPGYIPVRLERGCLFGRGAVDAKGSLAAFLSAAERVKAALKLRLVFIAAVGEETPFSPGAHYVRDRYRPDFCLVGEPSGWDSITLGYKGCLAFTARVRRPSGHSAGPEPSAAEIAVDFWRRVQALCAELNGGKNGFSALEAGLRELGSTNDGLTDEASLGISLRLPPGLEAGVLIERLKALDPRVKLSFFPAQGAYKGEKNTPLARAFLEAIRTQGGRPVFKLKSGTADMNIVGPAWRVPILAYGPGDSRLDHTPGEHLPLPEYARAVAVLAQVLTHPYLGA
ncbi:MAG: [amino group carrier protein]-lysine/ornithine hydrolase [Bacillota bacterium]|nr:[amino group carrier protein]-lysine/ornithine hydrolase [Bacillota bacterium]MDK2856015.1 [amino group carrier protein]-lysine/ornithine hydrolase [Bacillota bacterium]MDK2925887.1 [amino group carrier protein]-lysine/ornithine hydrolase [Bacillota bacterium]